jgi:hypothetical protein
MKVQNAAIPFRTTYLAYREHKAFLKEQDLLLMPA